ncbi:MAG: gamma carbonic anhydrase family protein, partial [Rhodospirillaceae bacterium]|nr:gamma carbonic anhydrase family protein [Rhodospirillaceae bacterium]
MSGLIIPYQGVFPDIAEDAFVAPNATIIGKVKIGAGSSIWFNTVLRGDVEAITVGERTSLQDGTIVHVTGGKYETHIGSDVLIGHKVLIHGATLEDGCFIGMSATVMDNVGVETG